MSNSGNVDKNKKSNNDQGMTNMRRPNVRRLISTAGVQAVEFYTLGSENNQRESNVAVNSVEMFRNNEPFPNGVYDAHMGTTDVSYKCLTCGKNKKHCPGHDGHMILNYPVYAPMTFNDMKKWIKLICFNCGGAIIAEDTYKSYGKMVRLDEASKIARNNAHRECVHCNTPHPVIKKNPREPLGLIEQPAPNADTRHLLPHKIAEVLNKVTDETVRKLGRSVKSHPRTYVLNIIKVPTTTIRPDTKKIGSSRNSNDNITTMLQLLIRLNRAIATVVPENPDEKFVASIYELNRNYYEMIRGGGKNVKIGNAANVSIAGRQKGKRGRYRKYMLGKRVRIMARSTITCDPTLMQDEVGVPLIFARVLSMEETVQPFNLSRLQQYVINGRNKYPGATKIVKSNGKEYSIEKVKPTDLEIGDKVFRDLITGDYVDFNRQPSLDCHHISTKKAVISENPNLLVLRLNATIAKLFNADFDGDYRTAPCA